MQAGHSVNESGVRRLRPSQSTGLKSHSNEGAEAANGAEFGGSGKRTLLRADFPARQGPVDRSGELQPAFGLRDFILTVQANAHDRSYRRMRSGWVYTFIVSGRRKPTRVIPNFPAISTASEDGAPTAAITGMETATAF